MVTVSIDTTDALIFIDLVCYLVCAVYSDLVTPFKSSVKYCWDLELNCSGERAISVA